jgi:hypothetical protein
VCDAFERIAKVELPEINAIIGCENELNYRNKLEFGCTNRKWLTNAELETAGEIDRRGIGFHVPGSFSGILDIQHCHLLDASNKVRLAIRDFALKHNYSFYNIKDKVGLLRNVLVRTTSTNEMLAACQFFRKRHQKNKCFNGFYPSFFSRNHFAAICGKCQTKRYHLRFTSGSCKGQCIHYRAARHLQVSTGSQIVFSNQFASGKVAV